jgi:hypothetical protein
VTTAAEHHKSREKSFASRLGDVLEEVVDL